MSDRFFGWLLLGNQSGNQSSSNVCASENVISFPTSITIRSLPATVLIPVLSCVILASFSGPFMMMTMPRWMKTATSGLTLSRNIMASSVHMWNLILSP